MSEENNIIDNNDFTIKNSEVEFGGYTYNKLAPIVIFVYKRADHTLNLLESLTECPLASDSDVYIYADGAKKPEDEADVAAVRNLIHEERWTQVFNSLTIIESSANRGLANSIIGGATDVINRYGKVLVLEDDLIVEPQYIAYMNQALDAFGNDNSKYAVVGWTYPVNALKGYKKDAWVHYRPCSWGWGTWKDRWDKVVWNHEDAKFEEKLSDSAWCDKFKRAGNDLAPMLRRQLDGKIDSWAIRWTAAATDLDLMTVFPTVPVITNDGRDGSGTHAHAVDNDSRAKVNNISHRSCDDIMVNGKLLYDFSGISINKKIIRQAWNYDSDTIYKKIKRNLRKIFVEHKVPEVLKKH